MISLVDVGLRLDGLMFAVGYAMEAPETSIHAPLAEVEAAVEELSRAVELTQILLGSELQIVDVDQFIDTAELERLRSESG